MSVLWCWREELYHSGWLLCVLVGGGVIQENSLVWKRYSTRHHRCAKSKKIQAPLSSLRRAGKEVNFVTLPPQYPLYWELLDPASQLPTARELWDPSTAGPGGPKEMGMEFDPLSPYSPSHASLPGSGPPPPEMGCLSPCPSLCPQPTHTQGCGLWRSSDSTSPLFGPL